MAAFKTTPTRPPRSRPRAESDLKPADSSLPAIPDPAGIRGFPSPAVEILITQGINVPFAVPDGASMSRAQAITVVARELTRACDSLRIDKRRKTDGSPMKSKGWVDVAVSNGGAVTRMGGAAWDGVLDILDSVEIRPAWSDAAVNGLARSIAHGWDKMTPTAKGAAIDLLNGLEAVRRCGSARKLRELLRGDPVAAQAFMDANAGFEALGRVQTSRTVTYLQHIVFVVLSLAMLIAIGYVAYTGQGEAVVKSMASITGFDSVVSAAFGPRAAPGARL